MSQQLSLIPTADQPTGLMVRDARGRYRPASPEQILDAARQVVAQQTQRGATFDSPEAVKRYLRIMLSGLEHEVFMILFLDAQHRLIASEEMFRGTINQATVYPREVVKACLRHNAAAVILSHNHPSGNPEPSAADESLTLTLAKALTLIDVRILDHIIVAGNQTLSFAEQGLL